MGTSDITLYLTKCYNGLASCPGGVTCKLLGGLAAHVGLNFRFLLNLLCESKYCERFDLTLTFYLCDNQSDKRSKPASHKAYYRYSLRFFSSCILLAFSSKCNKIPDIILVYTAFGFA